MSDNKAEEYVNKDNIEGVIFDFHRSHGILIWLNEEDAYGDNEIEIVAEITSPIRISWFKTEPDEWFDFVYDDIPESELVKRAEELQETLTTIYIEDELRELEGELYGDIYNDYCRWYESKYEKEPDYDTLMIEVEILINHENAFDPEGLIHERQLIQDQWGE